MERTSLSQLWIRNHRWITFYVLTWKLAKYLQSSARPGDGNGMAWDSRESFADNELFAMVRPFPWESWVSPRLAWPPDLCTLCSTLQSPHKPALAGQTEQKIGIRVSQERLNTQNRPDLTYIQYFCIVISMLCTYQVSDSLWHRHICGQLWRLLSQESWHNAPSWTKSTFTLASKIQFCQVRMMWAQLYFRLPSLGIDLRLQEK